MAQFIHTNITNPTITHAGKVMHVIADCIKAIKGVGYSGRIIEMQQLKQLTKLKKQAV